VAGALTTGVVPPSKVIDGCTIVADPTPSYATGADLAEARLESVNLADADLAGATMSSSPWQSLLGLVDHRLFP
jgi:hypothetical protein